MRWLDGTTDAMDMNLGKLQEMAGGGTGRPGVLQSMRSRRVGHDLATKQQLKDLVGLQRTVQLQLLRH